MRRVIYMAHAVAPTEAEIDSARIDTWWTCRRCQSIQLAPPTVSFIAGGARADASVHGASAVHRPATPASLTACATADPAMSLQPQDAHVQ